MKQIKFFSMKETLTLQCPDFEAIFLSLFSVLHRFRTKPYQDNPHIICSGMLRSAAYRARKSFVAAKCCCLCMLINKSGTHLVHTFQSPAFFTVWQIEACETSRMFFFKLLVNIVNSVQLIVFEYSENSCYCIVVPRFSRSSYLRIIIHIYTTTLEFLDPKSNYSYWHNIHTINPA